MTGLTYNVFVNEPAPSNTLPGANNVPGTPNGLWTTNTGDYSYGFDASSFLIPPQPRNFVGVQEIRMRVRRSPESSSGTLDAIAVQLGGVGGGWITIATPGLTVSQSGVGHLVTATFNADDYPGMTHVSAIGIAATSGGGNPNNRATVQIEYMVWEAQYDREALGTPIRSWDSTTETWVEGRLKKWNGSSWELASLQYHDGDGWVFLE